MCLALLVLVASTEPLFAEAHDGDAPAAVVPTALVGLVAAAAVPDASTVGVAAATRTSTGVIRAAVGASHAPNRQAPGRQQPAHAVHVCHCAHAHGGFLLPEPFALTTGVRRVTHRVRTRSDRLPPSPRPEPRLRPPVLLQGV